MKDMTEIIDNKHPMKLMLFILILLLLCFLLGLYYKNELKAEQFSKKQEQFSNYQDVKTKTVNWCDKMQKVGLLTPDQFDECITTFKDSTAGLLPKELHTQTGMGRNYSLYNTQSEELSSDITGDNTNTIMLSTVDGLTLACKSDNSIYLVPNINDPKVNQNELYFTLIPQNQDVYSILSHYGKYLITTLTTADNANANDANDTKTASANATANSNTDYCASFSGVSIGPMASWNITRINEANVSDQESRVMISSIQFANFNLLYDNSSNGLKIAYGNSDNMIWTMTSKLQTVVSDENTFTGAEYYVVKDKIINKLSNSNELMAYDFEFTTEIKNILNIYNFESINNGQIKLNSSIVAFFETIETP